MASKANKEPSTAPPAEQWFPLTLGSTIRDASPSTRFYSLRYEFKPASIDTTRPGTLHKSTDNKVTVDFCNNQAGKPKVSFQGNSEDCKELDAVIFFDGQNFRLERLHRAVKSLRHLRLPGEALGAVNVNSSVGAVGGGALATETTTPPAHQNGGIVPAANVNIEKISPLVQVEEKTIAQTDTKASEKKKTSKRKAEAPPPSNISKPRTPPRPPTPAEDKSNNDVQVDVDGDDADERGMAINKVELEMPSQQLQQEGKVEEEVVSDYEIEDVDVSEDEEGLNAAEALRAQAAAGSDHKGESSSSSSGSGSGSSGSGSSGSGSGSSSSTGSGSDDEDSVSSADDT